MSPTQHSIIQTLVNTMIHRTTRSAWERKAIHTHIRVVASSPLNLRRTFERLANKNDKATSRPPCLCNSVTLHIWQSAGIVSNVQAHFALLPVTVLHEGQPIRPSDPLPCSGARSRMHAIQSLRRLAHTVHVQLIYSNNVLSTSLPPTDGIPPYAYGTAFKASPAASVNLLASVLPTKGQKFYLHCAAHGYGIKPNSSCERNNIPVRH